ncbi:MAG: OsmC family protein [Candidatus Hodarchaeales archaeon]|jgi:uncharacterized OsmC-like protein
MVSSNHVNVGKLQELAEKIQKDPAAAKINPKVAGKWIFKQGEPQFRSVVEVEGGTFTIDADMPTSLGGWGSQPGPLQYCLYGLASCYAFTFAALAAEENIELKRLEIAAESNIDVSKVLGLSDNPIVEGAKWTVTVDSDADDAKIDELKKLAEERCPAVYCLTNPIKLNIDVKHKGF